MVRVRVLSLLNVKLIQTVENSLDTRGYCTRFTLCAYYASTPSYNSHRVTLPPSNYPSTAPYAKLSAHFAKLVKAGLLKPQIVKMLLYPQARQSIDMQIIPMRIKRRHKAVDKVTKRSKKNYAEAFEENSSCNSSERSELERQDAFEIPTDSEDEDESICGEFSIEGDEGEEDFNECETDPFEYLNMYKHRRNSNKDSTGTFIDHGSKENTLGKQRLSSSINLPKLSSHESAHNIMLKKESLIIGSKAIQALARKSTDSCTIMHTTTAQLNLGSECKVTTDLDANRKELGKLSIMPQQTSETSHSSSVYDGRGMGGVYLACENLTELTAHDIKTKQGTTTQSPPDRHSMPNIFVGNRFNRSPNTAVYLPSWKDRNDMQKQSADAAEGSVEAEVTHASTLDLPAECLTAPDKLQAELLYNFNGTQTDIGDNHIIEPPVLYKSTSSSCEKKTAVPTAAAECNEAQGQDVTDRPSSMRRCISYQYIQMSNNDKPALPIRSEVQPRQRNRRVHEPTSEHEDGENHKCKCCASSQCPSPRSSDSGMAGSCTIASPDPPNPEAAYYYGGIGGLQFDEEHLDPTRFDVCGNFREKFLKPENTITTTTCTSASTTAAPLRVLTKSVLQKSNKTAKAKPISENSNMLICSGVDNKTDVEPASGAMFRSGMYAHWWKKEKLPAEVVHGIAVATHNNRSLPQMSSQSSKDSVCSSCQCSLAASGFSEGSSYCAMCQDCLAYASLVAEAQPAHTTTTNTSSFSCPLCSADDMNLSGNFTPAVMTTSSTASSIDCPICLKFLDLHRGSSSSVESGIKAKAVVEGKQI